MQIARNEVAGRLPLEQPARTCKVPPTQSNVLDIVPFVSAAARLLHQLLPLVPPHLCLSDHLQINACRRSWSAQAAGTLFSLPTAQVAASSGVKGLLAVDCNSDAAPILDSLPAFRCASQ
jgi:hypothetical protein